MIKSKTAKALIIGTCMVLSSAMGVYADTNDTKVPPAVVQPAENQDGVMTIQIESVKNNDVLTQKQQEIDKYVFEEHKADMEKLGINITSTAVVGDFVEVAMAPFDTQKAQYLYDIFGNQQMLVVSGDQAVPLAMVTTTVADKAAPAEVTAQKDTNFFATIINTIVAWFESIF